ncbi:MAG: hypothetical protein GC160_01070 [Acidobacteria bacterium]|nr:hypothetical protein [Acidobacteriota bacterium]
MKRSIPLLFLLALPSLAQNPPVILLNGYDVATAGGGDCVVEPDSTGSFGRLEEFLRADGREVLFFDNCTYGAPPIEELGQHLGETIDALGVPQVDLVGISMGGMIIRSYLAGKLPGGGFDPPLDPKVRKAVFLGTPNFGSPLADLPVGGDQIPEIRRGSRFVWDLATWNQGTDDLREIDALALAGSGQYDGRGDGSVGVSSASLLSFYGQPVEKSRVIPACHNDAAFILCSTRVALAQVDSEEHPTAVAIRAFLADRPDWMSVGVPVPEHPATVGLADVLVELRDASDALITDASRPVVTLPGGETSTLDRGVAGLFYKQDLPGALLPLTVDAGSAGTLSASIEAGLGKTRLLPLSPGPRLIRAVPSAGLLSTLSLAPDSLASLFGSGFTDSEAAAEALPLPTQLAGVQVRFDDQPLELLYAGPGQVNVRIPAGALGLHTLTLESPLGVDAFNVFLEPAAPAVFTLDGSGTGAAAALNAQTFELIAPATPIAAGDYAALYVTGIGDQEVEVILGGQPQTVSYFGPAPGFAGLQQVNFQVQGASGSQELLIRAGGRFSNAALLAIR